MVLSFVSDLPAIFEFWVSNALSVKNCVDNVAIRFDEVTPAASQLCQSINQSINQKRIRVTKVTNVTARPLLQC